MSDVVMDVDSNQQLAQQFRVHGIPAVEAFRDGVLGNDDPRVRAARPRLASALY